MVGTASLDDFRGAYVGGGLEGAGGIRGGFESGQFGGGLLWAAIW